MMNVGSRNDKLAKSPDPKYEMSVQSRINTSQ
jgi:hypothetical protein